MDDSDKQMMHRYNREVMDKISQRLHQRLLGYPDPPAADRSKANVAKFKDIRRGAKVRLFLYGEPEGDFLVFGKPFRWDRKEWGVQLQNLETGAFKCWYLADMGVIRYRPGSWNTNRHAVKI